MFCVFFNVFFLSPHTLSPSCSKRHPLLGAGVGGGGGGLEQWPTTPRMHMLVVGKVHLNVRRGLPSEPFRWHAKKYELFRTGTDWQVTGHHDMSSFLIVGRLSRWKAKVTPPKRWKKKKVCHKILVIRLRPSGVMDIKTLLIFYILPLIFYTLNIVFLLAIFYLMKRAPYR